MNDWPGALAKVYVAYGYLSASNSINEAIRFRESPRLVHRIRKAGRRATDILGAAGLLCLNLPALALVVLAIKLDSPGPVLFSQERVGPDGKPFSRYKFRTMRVDVIDPARHRVTQVGSFLRKTDLDQLPVLLNILRGDMSLVGLRPKLPNRRDLPD